MNILIGVSGGIAAYKTCSLVARLTKKHSVRVIMTDAAKEFVGPLTFETLTNHSLIDGSRGLKDEVVTMTTMPGRQIVPHIYYPQIWADLFVVAPATANIIGKAANGIADDFLSSCILASDKPILFVPAMNQVMYEKAATQRNLTTLKADGEWILEPEIGNLACGITGKGKMPSPEIITKEIDNILIEQYPQFRAIATVYNERSSRS